MTRRTISTCLAAALLVPGSGAPAQTTGTRDAVRHYPPDRHADFLHMRLDLTIEDMNTPVLRAVQKLEFAPIARPLQTLTLDAKLMQIVDAKSPGRAVAYSHDGQRVTYTFQPPIEPDETVELYTRYVVDRPPEGLYWTPETPEWPGRAAQIHTQGEPETSSYWFPCHDYPNDRLTTEIIATVPDGFLVSSNGRLVSKRPAARGGVRFHWLQDRPHVNYLVSLVIGEFDVVDIGTDGLPMSVYVPPGRADDVEHTYGRTPDMVAFFEHRFDEPFPWDRYAQLVVWNFNFGGMENTAATTMHDTAIISSEARPDHELTGLIAHELAHQWFGNLITCDSWDHIWLNEGFATYCEALWLEHDKGRDAYQSDMLANFDSVIAGDTGLAPHDAAMVSNVYRRPLDNFSKGASPYAKGASVLHMLRMRLGDVPFFAGLAAYVDRHKFGLVETPDFRKSMEEVSGDSLQRFFAQWTARPGVPRLDIDASWNDRTSELTLRIRQTQSIDGYNPAYAFTLPVWISTGTGPEMSDVTAMIEIDRRETESRIALAAPPTLVAFDPGMHVAAEMVIEQPDDLWRAQAERGPSLYARVQAIRALGRSPQAGAAEDENTALLARAAQSPEAHPTVRREAIRALGARGAETDFDALLETAPDQPRLRAERLAALSAVEDAEAGRDRSRAAAIREAARDPAQSVRAAAMRAIGALELHSHFDLLQAGLREESQHDSVRRAAISALSAFEDDQRALSLVLPYTKRGYLSTTRAAAIQAAVELGAPADRFEPVLAYLGDHERRVHRAAGQAIADRALPRGLAALRDFAESTRDVREREDALRWIEHLESRRRHGG